MDLLKKIQNVDRRWLYVLVFIAVAFPILKPLGLPVEVQPETRGIYDAIEKLKPGDVMLLAPEYGTPVMTEIEPMIEAVFRHAVKKSVKVILFGISVEGPSLAQPRCQAASDEYGKKYGVDWVNLGYKPGKEVTLKKMVDDIWAASANVDIFGTPLSQIPLMQSVHKAEDINLFISCDAGSPGVVLYLTYIGIPAKRPVGGGCTAVGAPQEMPYFKSGQYVGLLMGLKGAAEYEVLIGRPGKAVRGMDAQSMAHLLVIIFVLMANVGYFLERRAKPSGSGR